MSKKTEPLTAEELAEIKKRRVAARERARRLPPLSEDEDAAIIAAATSDPDARPLTAQELTRMRPAHEVVPNLVADSLRRPRGRPKLSRPKVQVALRLDYDVLEHYRGRGPGWQTTINMTLRKAAGLAKPQSGRERK